MSDNSAATDAMPVRRALQRCGGAPGCPCVSEASSVARPPSPVHTNSGDSVSRSASYRLTDSQGDSDSTVPDGVPEHEWSGLSVVRVKHCAHGRHAVLKKCWGGKHTGRRFLGCPVKDESKQCQFMERLDEPWPKRVQDSLKELWKELKITRRCEANANEALIEALQVKEVATKARSNLQDKVDRTKRVAHEVCLGYHRKAAVAVINKSKLMFLIYCLLGVIAFLVSTIFFMAK